MPSCSARRAARPCSFTAGCPVGRRSISMSRQPIPRTPRPSTFETASLAAHRPAMVSGRPRTYAASAGVRTRLVNRSPNLASESLMRETRMMSIPSSVVPAGGVGRAGTGRAPAWCRHLRLRNDCRAVGRVRASEANDPRPRSITGNCALAPRDRSRPLTGHLLHRHRLGQVARLVHVRGRAAQPRGRRRAGAG